MSNDLPADLQQALLDASLIPRILVTSDFDGTISPIVANPVDARPLPAAVDALVELATLSGTAVALISGRSLQDLGELSSAPTGVQLVGSHGAEFGNDFLDSIPATAKALLPDLVDKMLTIAAKFPGATVETKPVSVAFHVRNVAAAQAQEALDQALGAVSDRGIHVTEGKAVREFAVIETNKGAAIDLLRGQHKAGATVYFGDDVTDEKAFDRLDPTIDVAVKVGAGHTKARYRVEDPEAVTTALTFLLEARRTH